MNLKSMLQTVKDHKDTIIKKSLIIGGSVVGVALTAGLLSSADSSDDEVLEIELDENEPTEAPEDTTSED